MRHALVLVGTLLVLSACGKQSYPAPDAHPKNKGPGGPAVTFDEGQLFQHCAYLSGGPLDVDHHNLKVMYDGYLLMPWAPEWGPLALLKEGGGGLSFFDVSDPCNPKEVGTGYSKEMRESHSIGFSDVGGRWAVVSGMGDTDTFFQDGGIQFWDVSDVTNPKAVHTMFLPGFFYPDAYDRVVNSVFWQAPYVYAAGGNNGIYVIDALDPKNPRLVGQYHFEPLLKAFQVQAIGNLLFVGAGGEADVALLDISDPADAQPIPGGRFQVTDGAGVTRNAYASNTSGGYALFARNSGGSGLIIWDIRDPTNPTYVGDIHVPGGGGYVFQKEEFAFVGNSSSAAIFDVSDPTEPRQVGPLLHLKGDLDTFTPIGNVAVLAVDEDAEDGKASAIVPWRTEPDTVPPKVTWSVPEDGATGLALTSRVGVGFSEMVDVKSAWAGSVRLYEDVGNPDAGRVDGYVSAQEHIVNFWPKEPLKPNTWYVFEIPSGGLADYNGNRIQEAFRITFSTAGK